MIDTAAFETLSEQHRHELRVHCYRMLGNFQEAEDLVQETMLRAWRHRDQYAGRSTVRAWLYKIATNACLDTIAKRPKLQAGAGAEVEVPWLEPYPDRLLAPAEEQPDALVVEKETIELAYIVAIQHLPAKQRAVLILRDVVGWSAKDTAALLDTSVASANSALQRARETMRARLPAQRAEWSATADEQQQALVARYIEALDAGDADAFVEMMREDATFAMPPEDGTWMTGNRAIVDSWVSGGFGSEEFGHLRGRLTYANRQPAIANYHLKPGDDTYRLFAVDVLRIEDGQIADITAFAGDAVLAAFGLPAVLTG